jgi:hypothetical protein
VDESWAVEDGEIGTSFGGEQLVVETAESSTMSSSDSLKAGRWQGAERWAERWGFSSELQLSDEEK